MSVIRILTNDNIKKSTNSARGVPYCLTADQKQKRLDIAILLKERFDVEEQAFLRRIVAIGEKWNRDFEPQLKSQTDEW